MPGSVGSMPVAVCPVTCLPKGLVALAAARLEHSPSAAGASLRTATAFASDYAFWITMTALLVEGSRHLHGLSGYPKFVPRTILSRVKLDVQDRWMISSDMSRTWSCWPWCRTGARRGRRRCQAHEAFPGLRESGSLVLVCCADEAIADPAGWPGCGCRRLERFPGQYCGRA